MATSTTIPVEEYLRSDYEPDADFVDGEVELRPMGEYDHATWQQALQQWFLQHKMEWGIRVRPELRVQVSPTTFRVPDVVVFDRHRPVEKRLTHPPIAVFEVLSPEDRMLRMLRKLRDYEQMGVQNIFVIETEPHRVYRFRNGLLDRCGPLSVLDGASGMVAWDEVKALVDSD